MNEKGFRTLAALDAVAKAHNTKPGQIALAWLIARPSVTAPIVSATNMDQLAEIMQAPEIKLTPAEIIQIDVASK
jgi:aryl-alcohol dehydrogenase-like predicted oxidoreductase